MNINNEIAAMFSEGLQLLNVDVLEFLNIKTLEELSKFYLGVLSWNMDDEAGTVVNHL